MSYNEGRSTVGPGWRWFIYRPRPPYIISQHIEAFSIPGEPTPVLYDPGARCCRSLVVSGEEAFPVECCFRGEPDDPLIECRTRGSMLENIRGIVWRRLRVGFDYNIFLKRSKPYPVIHRLALKHRGLRPTRLLSLYEALTDSIVKQRIKLEMALRITSRIVRGMGRHIVTDGKHYYWYPKPHVLSETDPCVLRGFGLTRMKARALVEVAKAEVEGRLPRIEEVNRDPWSYVGELTRIYGVGEWTAELSIAMVLEDFRLGPRTDLSVKRGLEKTGINLSETKGLEEYHGLIMYLASLHHSPIGKPT